MIPATIPRSKQLPKACDLDAELLSAVEACVVAIDSRDESELHRQLAIREGLMAQLREVLVEDMEAFARLKLLKVASRIEEEMFARLHAWWDEMGAQLNNIECHNQLSRVYKLD